MQNHIDYFVTILITQLLTAMSSKPFTSASWLKLASSKTVLMRGVICALIVGTILCVINHCDCLANGMFGWSCFAKSSLTAVVPFLVSVISSVHALKQQQNKKNP